MRRRRALAVVLVPLLLWGCPGVPTGITRVNSASTPVFRMYGGGGINTIQSLAFHRYRVRSGETVVWQIDRTQTCTGPYGLSDAYELRYGEQPPCYVTTIAPVPLDEGRPYVIEGFWDLRGDLDERASAVYFFMTRIGQVQGISAEDYAAQTGDTVILPPAR